MSLSMWVDEHRKELDYLMDHFEEASKQPGVKETPFLVYEELLECMLDDVLEVWLEHHKRIPCDEHAKLESTNEKVPSDL